MAVQSVIVTCINPRIKKGHALFVPIVALTIRANHWRYLFNHCFYDNKYYFLFVQIAFYFSIRKRLRAFLRIPGFSQLLEHEYSRPLPRDQNILTDVYDGSAWKRFMGTPSSPCSRIGLQGCTDGFQAHTSGSLSMKPVVFANLSLPPALRFKTEYMFLNMLLPSNAKSHGLKKYFDFAATFELDSLYQTGIIIILLVIIYCLYLCSTHNTKQESLASR